MVAGSAESRVLLVYDGQQLEFDASLAERRGGLQALQREAELAWGLQPASYTMSDVLGKVDSQEALLRSIRGSTDGGPCVLDVLEHSEWKAFRLSMATFESKIMAKVDSTLAQMQEDMKQLGIAVNGTVAPMLKCMSVEMVEIRTRIDQAETVLCQNICPMMQQIAHAQIDSRAACADLQGIVPLVQCLALEQLELRNLASSNFSSKNHSKNHAATAATAHEEVDADADKLQEKLGNDVSHRLSCLERADQLLLHEFHELQNSAKAAEVDLREVREEVKGLINNDANFVSKRLNGVNGVSADPDARFGWNEPLPNGIPFSGKVSVALGSQCNAGGQLKKGGAAWKCSSSEMSGVAPPFARGPPVRSLERISCSRSTPHLPPLM